MNLRFFLALSLLFCQFSLVFAQADLSWSDPLNDPSKNFVHGQGWSGLDYHRLPDDAENKVRKSVWGLSRHAAGVKLRFNTNAEEIKVKYVVSGRQAMPHMPATGVSGLDLYLRKSGNGFVVVIPLVIPYNIPSHLSLTILQLKILTFTCLCTMR